MKQNETINFSSGRLFATSNQIIACVNKDGEAYQGALVFYSNVKNAAKVKTPKAGTIYDDLAARFPGGTSKKKV